MSIIRGLLAVVVVTVLAVGTVVWWTLPGRDERVVLAGLNGAVDVVFDDDGVPRITAADETDAAMALGYLHARERMFQMDMTRRAAAGELSEVIGGLGLRNDRRMRLLGVRRSAEADLELLPAPTLALLEAYAAGVNAWIAQRGRFAGLEYLALGTPREWAPVDSVLWGKMMGLFLSGNYQQELARAGLVGRVTPEVLEALWPRDAGGPGQPAAAVDPAVGATSRRLASVLPRFPERFTLPESASNEWAVDGRFSASGAPLLAGDPHLGFGMPGTWYLARLEIGGRALAGATAPGVPLLVLGHNGRIAWTFTTTGADVQDVFVETASGSGYMTPEGVRPFIVRRELIRVRGGEDVVMTVRETRHGPVISDLVAPEGPILSIAMGNLARGDTTVQGFHGLNKAADVAEAGTAAAHITGVVQNMLVADREGIALFVTGRVPVRRSGDGSLPARGDDGSQDWIGFAGGAQLPRFVAPASGRLVNGNERIAPPDFPVFMGQHWYGDWRARRIRGLLAATPKHTLDSFAAMQVDTVSTFAVEVLPTLLRLTPGDAAGRQALGLLGGWNGRMDAELPQPLIFNAWMRRFRAALLAHAGVTDGAAPSGWEMVAPAVLAENSPLCGGTCGPLLRQALSEAVAEQVAEQGADIAAWRWGRAHQAVFAHPLLGEIPVLSMLGTRRIESPGDDNTLFRAAMRGSFDAVHGAGFRAVYDLADLSASRFVVTPGQSGHAFSGQAWNFMRRWREGGMVTLGAQGRDGWRMRLVGADRH